MRSTMAEEHDSSHNDLPILLSYCPTGTALLKLWASCSHTCREKTDQPNENHLFSSTIIMALSIAKRHNLNTLFGGRGKKRLARVRMRHVQLQHRKAPEAT